MRTRDDCQLVVERVALGEPLGEVADHAAECTLCMRTIELPAQLRASARAIDPSDLRSRNDPGLGFSARMTVAAQQRIGERRRKRTLASIGAGLALAAGAVVAVTRPAPEPATVQPMVSPAPVDPSSPLEDSELAALLQLADTRRAARASAPWRRIERPLKPYIQLVKGVAR